MNNLARAKDSPNVNREVEAELRRAMIPSVHWDINPRHTEVPTTRCGKLGPFTFKRAWYYWIVRGPTPLPVAQELYADPVGVDDVRVNGYAGGIEPVDVQIAWYTVDGKRVTETAQRGKYEQAAKQWPNAFKNAAPICWHDDPISIGATGYVNSYHIDSEVGLRLFSDTVRRHGLDKIERPTWWREDV